MKITPCNQTLILAGEGRGPGNPPGSSFGNMAGSTGSVLQRVTIVASQPDATLVYLRAEYAPPPAAHYASPGFSHRAAIDSAVDAPVQSASQSAPQISSSPGTSVVARQQPPAASRDGYGNAMTGSRDTGMSSYLKPAEQYARTQRILGNAAQVQRVDVHA